MQDYRILQQTDFKYIFCSDRSGASMEEKLKWNISNLTGKWDDWIFTLKQPFHKVKGVSHLPFCLPCFAFFVLHLEFSITLSRPFVLSLKWSIYTIWRAWIQKCAATFGLTFSAILSSCPFNSQTDSHILVNRLPLHACSYGRRCDCPLFMWE